LNGLNIYTRTVNVSNPVAPPPNPAANPTDLIVTGITIPSQPAAGQPFVLIPP